ncbi:hypothetical protein, partial [Klebsiella aerogenes]|uniref:hypothetical protein n=1 Tax=Klebsiella aerogenes TaxID=548 RepID=UPI001952C2A3
ADLSSIALAKGSGMEVPVMGWVIVSCSSPLALAAEAFHALCESLAVPGLDVSGLAADLPSSK